MSERFKERHGAGDSDEITVVATVLGRRTEVRVQRGSGFAEIVRKAAQQLGIEEKQYRLSFNGKAVQRDTQGAVPEFQVFEDGVLAFVKNIQGGFSHR